MEKKSLSKYKYKIAQKKGAITEVHRKKILILYTWQGLVVYVNMIYFILFP